MAEANSLGNLFFKASNFELNKSRSSRDISADGDTVMQKSAKELDERKLSFAQRGLAEAIAEMQIKRMRI